MDGVFVDLSDRIRRMSFSEQQSTMCKDGAHVAPAPGPFANRGFVWLWVANIIAALGISVQGAASGWMMTDLAPNPMMVSLVQAAAQLPILLLALPAGALADLIDRRRYLILTNMLMLFSAAALATLTALGLVDSLILLGATCLLSVGFALNNPAWAASVPLMVPRHALPQALVLNAVGFNIARAIGPALGGFILAFAGAASAFMLNVASFAIVVAIVGLLLTFPNSRRIAGVPPEPLRSAMRVGMAYVAAEPVVRNALVRTAAFFGFGSAMWAFLPLYCRDVLGLSSAFFGVMMGMIGVGAVAGGFTIRWLQERFSRNNLVMLAGTVCGFALVLTALFPFPAVAAVALAIFGTGWVVGASSLQATVQLASAPWVRARTLAFYQAVFNGAMGVGAIFWGWLGEYAGLTGTLMAAGLLGWVTALLMRAVLLPSEIQDPSTSTFPANRMVTIADEMVPLLSSARNRLVVAISYEIDAADVPEFRTAMAQVRAARYRDGATGWILSQEVSDPMHWVETFHVRDWHEFQRGLARVNQLDSIAVEHARSFHRGITPPHIRLLLREQSPVTSRRQ